MKPSSLFFLLLLLSSSFLFAQSNQKKKASKSYSEIRQLIMAETDPIQKRVYTQEYIEKGKLENNILEICRGYHSIALLFKDEKKLHYADSILSLTKNNQNDYYPALAYQLRGDFFYDRNDYKKALDEYLIFSSFANKKQNKSLIVSSNYYIGITKRRAGDQPGALKIYRENFSYATKNKNAINPVIYLRFITALVNLFNDMREIDSTMYYSNFGMNEALRLKKEEFINHFSLSQGVAHHFRGEYYTAIDSIEKRIPYFKNNKKDKNLEFAYFYTGESYWKIGNKEKAVQFFKEVDTMFLENGSIFPSLGETYPRLMEYYEEQEDLQNQVVYFNRLKRIDSISKADNLALYKELIQRYDIPELQGKLDNANKRLEDQQANKRILQLILFPCLALLIFGFLFQYRKRRIYKKRFLEILENTSSNGIPEKKKQPEKELAVPEEITQNILLGLESFENENGFTANDVTLNSLAQQLLTNPNYLSKVVNFYKKTSFSNYINNLRIDYTVEQLKTNPIFKKYTIKAISYEVGFNNVQSFSKAFYNSKGINPSYFIKELKKLES